MLSTKQTTAHLNNMKIVPEPVVVEESHKEPDNNSYEIKTRLWLSSPHPQKVCSAALKSAQIPLKPKKTNTISMAERTLDLEAIDQSMICHSSANFTISCGTVTLDLEASKVLLIFNRKLRIYQLPKGRKNIGEGCLKAALRETYEETGFRVKPLALKVATRATQPRNPTTLLITTNDNGNGNGNGRVAPVMTKSGLTADVENTEPLAMVTYPDPQTSSPTPVSKMVFFYAATRDQCQIGQDVNTQDEHENMGAGWVSVAKAVELLRFDAEKEVVIKAVALL